MACRMVRVMASATIAAVGAEAAVLTSVVAELTDSDLVRPTPCPPWTVAGLLAHVIIAVGRVAQALEGRGDGSVPAAGLVTAAGYYQPDHRFSPAVNADRIELARALADRLGSAAAIAAELRRCCLAAVTMLSESPADRVVVTRHGDPMLATEFARTRVIELGVHGLDLAIGLGLPPWLTPQAAGVLEELLLQEGDGGPAAASTLRASLGTDRAGLIAKLTGRAELTAREGQVLHAAGVRLLPLG